MSIENSLNEFVRRNKFSGKGKLCVALVITRHAKEFGLPLDPKLLVTEGSGQVKGLGKAAVQSILKEYGIDRTLAEEGGRTSRGSIGNMQIYVSLLNGLHAKGPLNLDEIEKWWINQVRNYFASKPFVLRYDSAKSIKAIINDLIDQAEKRQKEATGFTYVGTMLQHLVGAKLNIILTSPPEHHGASVADEVSDREGDFVIDDIAIHVTSSPSEALIRKCKRNINNDMKPIIITTSKLVAEGLAKQAEIKDRVETFDAVQFLAENMYEIGNFTKSGSHTTIKKLISEYNIIINNCETDPSLIIKVT